MNNIKFRGWYAKESLMFDISMLRFENNLLITTVPGYGEKKCRDIIDINVEIQVADDKELVIIMQKVPGEDFYEGDILRYFDEGDSYEGEPSFTSLYLSERCGSKFILFDMWNGEKYDSDDCLFDEVVGNIFQNSNLIEECTYYSNIEEAMKEVYKINIPKYKEIAVNV